MQIDFPVKVRLFFVMESKDLYLDRGVNYTLPTIQAKEIGCFLFVEQHVA